MLRLPAILSIEILCYYGLIRLSNSEGYFIIRKLSGKEFYDSTDYKTSLLIDPGQIQP